MIFESFIRAITQLFNPKIIGVVLKAVMLTVIGFLIPYILLVFLLFQLDWGGLDLFGFELVMIAGWLSGISFAVLSFVVGLIGWGLFPIVATAFIGLFSDQIIDAIEADDYQDRPAATDQGLVASLLNAVRFLAVLLAIHLALLPLYLITMAFFGLGAILFALVNAWFIGREYFEMVALRRLDRRQMKDFRAAHPLLLLGFGMLATFSMSIPIIGFLIPVIMVIMMTHLFHHHHAPPAPFGISLNAQ
ncbi:MAG: EI24 domain-containing protein [Alphaproteobacteria bacterium]